MTITTETNRWTFNGNGVTTSFSYTNLIFSNTDLDVFLSGVLQILTTDYSVSGAGNPAGGNITFVVAPPTGTNNVVVVRDVPAQQQIDYLEGGKFPAESHERGLDRGIIVNQQNQAALLRTLRLPDSEPDFSIEPIPDAASRKGTRLGFDLATGKPISITDDITGVAATAFGASLVDDVDAAAARVTLGLEVPSQAEAEAGTATVERAWTAERVAQAIAALSEPVGAVEAYIGATAPTGWVLASGRTIGNALSGATERANADTEDLFTLLWDDWADAEAPVSGGRGASAAADFAADKTITLADLRGRAPVGKDNMGGNDAARMTTAGSGIDGDTLGKAGGTETHVLVTAEIPVHGHTLPVNDTVSGASTEGKMGSGISNAAPTSSTGGDGAHQNTQPSIIMSYIIKL